MFLILSWAIRTYRARTLRVFNRLSILIAVLLTAVILIMASFFPTSRVWGATEWAYLAVWVRVFLVLVLGIAAGLLLWSDKPGSHAKDAPDALGHDWSSWFTVLGVASIAGVVFYIFHTQIHLLGDGYLLLKSLASETPLLRSRSYGEMFVHRWIKDALPFDGESAALASFRIVSIGAGILHTAIVGLLAPIIVGNRKQGWLFAVGMMTGGYALLHFGYVENYSLFGLAVAVYVYLGILISMRRISVWWIVPAFAATLFFHALGITLVLATFYMLMVHTIAMSRLNRMGRVWKVATILLVTLAWVGVAYSLLNRHMFLRIAFVPFSNDWWLLEGYSMFSLSHIADFANLLFLLAPSVLVLAAALVPGGLRRAPGDPRIRFLGVTTASVFAAAFALEAKIGMPRDWDLFSFIGYPLMALSLIMVLTSANRQHANRVTLIAVIIAVLCLGPRVITASTPAQGIQQFRDYADIDLRKNRTGWYALNKYYGEHSDQVAFESVFDLRRLRFPEEEITQLGNGAFARQQVDSAIHLVRTVIDLNPTYSAAWANLGYFYNFQGRYDSAASALETGNALNPDNPTVLAHLGLVYINLERDDDAKHAFLKAIGHDRDYFEPIIALARLCQKRGDHEDYVSWLERAVYLEKADEGLAIELGDELLRKDDFRSAATAFLHALEKGADRFEISQRLEAHPQLVPYMRR